tara:strand:- start:204897 stop:205763 length:867 start_codon:yes stop_codon:yes gene_type:complete
MVMHATKDIKYIHRPLTRDTLTSLDVYEPVSVNEPADDGVQAPADQLARPILLFIHGGGWALGDKKRLEHKADLALRHNWIYVSINYRLSPRVKHPEHARDAAAAIAYIHEHAGEYGGDPNNIVIMGHSAGAHIAAIVSSDESLLAEHDLTPADLRGVVLLDGAGYDIPSQMNSKLLGKAARTMYEKAFGHDPEGWQQASPTLQAKAGDTLPPLLGVHIDRFRSKVETNNLVDAWKATGASARVYYAPDPDHAGINTLVGLQDDPDAQAIEAFIIKAFAADKPESSQP